jgi:spermidine/putrescine transport system substrate-binding protein
MTTPNDDPGGDPAGPAELRAPARLSRRHVLRGLGAGALAAGSASLLAACDLGGGGAATGSTGGTTGPTGATVVSPSPSPAEDVDWDAYWAQQQTAGILDFANWPYYIDRDRNSDHPSLDLFTKRLGIKVNYSRTIRENAKFMDRIRPALQAGEPIGFDLIVISNGPELSELINSGWLTPLNHAWLPNFAENAGRLVRGPIWDPENRYSVAWQSGLTGIAYSPEAVEALGHRPTSIQDLWNPALRGKVGMMSDLVELGSAGMLAVGIDPAASSPDDWQTAADMLQIQKHAVDPRYYDQGYVEALGRRDTWITLAWSGDIFQLNNLGQPELRFVVPTEGAMFWTDNMLIPRNAEHPLDALAYMDFVYRPSVAAMIADWVWYICPVPAAADIVEKRYDDPDVANSPLVFPGRSLSGDPGSHSGSIGSYVRNYYVYADADEYAEWTSVFQPVIYST